MKKLLIFLSFLVLPLLARDDVDYFKERDIIVNKLNESIKLYSKGDAKSARQLASEAYFQHFENMEGPIGRNIGRKGYFMERNFTKLRGFYGKGEKIEKIQALVDGLIYDLDQVTPIIQNGFKIKAVASDPNYDKAKAEASARANLLKDCISSEMMFGASQSEAQKTCEAQQASEIARLADEASGKVQKAVHQKTDSEALEDLRQAASMNPKLQFLFDQLSDSFDDIISHYQKKEFALAADILREARTDIYVNSKLEIAINSYKNINMRVITRQLGSKIRSGELSVDELRAKSEEILDTIFEAMSHIDEEKIADIRADGYVVEEMNVDYTQVAQDIKIALAKIIEGYDDSSTKASINALQDVYLDIFEKSQMENKIGAIDSGAKLDIEAEFSEGKALILADAPKEQIEKVFEKINSLIAAQLDKLADSSPKFLFFAALGIILREGLEALIIVVAIVSYIVQSGNKDRLGIVYSALGWGVGLSFVTAFAVRMLIANSGQSRELIEGVTMLIAVVLLFYVGFWLLSNAHNKKYAENLKKQAKIAIDSGSSKTLWWTVFLAVFREGAETILFYQALLIDSQTSAGFAAVIGGLAVGLVALVILYFLLKAGAIKLPIKQFFLITSYIIFYMCFVFTGKGIMELVEGKVFTPHIVPFEFTKIPWLGIHPYYESLILQAIILVLLVGGIIYTQIKSKKEKQ